MGAVAAVLELWPQAERRIVGNIAAIGIISGGCKSVFATMLLGSFRLKA
jgi:hypothetical protein